MLDADNPLRYSELRDAAGGDSGRTLTRQLRELADDGLVLREFNPEVPPRVEYALTPIARRLEPTIAEHQAWGADWATEGAGVGGGVGADAGVGAGVATR